MDFVETRTRFLERFELGVRVVAPAVTDEPVDLVELGALRELEEIGIGRRALDVRQVDFAHVDAEEFLFRDRLDLFNLVVTEQRGHAGGRGDLPAPRHQRSLRANAKGRDGREDAEGEQLDDVRPCPDLCPGAVPPGKSACCASSRDELQDPEVKAKSARA